MASIVGNALYQIAETCARELGPFRIVGATSTSGAANVVVDATAIDSEAETGKYGGWYLYNVSPSDSPLLGAQGRVARGGFAGVSGTYTLTANFGSTPQSGGAWFGLGVMPMIDQDGLTGIRTCINRALRKLLVRIWYPFTAVEGQDEYDLGALWFASRDRFVRLMDPDPSGTGHPAIASQGWDVVQDGDIWTLRLGSAYPAGETFWLVMDAPANFRLYLNGAWANQSSVLAGLINPLDACLGEWNHVFQASLYECMKQLAIQAGGARKAYWSQRVVEQAAVVSVIKTYQMDDDGADDTGPTVGAGSWSNAWGMKSLWN